jgi:hypothetical protein
MKIPTRIGWLLGLGTMVLVVATSGCSIPISADTRSQQFTVAHLKGRARCFEAGSTNARSLKPGDKLQEGWLIQTPADDGYLDISMRKSLFVRFYPETSVLIARVTRRPEGTCAELQLRAGRIAIRAEPPASSETTFAKGVVCISDGLASVDESGRVAVRMGSALVTLAGQSEPTKVPERHIFDPLDGRIYPNLHFH